MIKNQIMVMKVKQIIVIKKILINQLKLILIRM